ncbi:helix-turn-helix domain-containing protein [Bacillus alveayuensis]|uniref:helix-turn-helix domain-containing protein n=1 Tax=Aeribacillus alveayuensis TaxID=279215 RepID=UPI0005CD8341|nr:helix-turn-helix domain-containing protein [Bacillus alveayuensis]
MKINDELKELSYLWKQRGVSIWQYRDGETFLLAEWTEIPQPPLLSQQLQVCFEKGIEFTQKEGFCIFIYEQWGIAFYGKEVIDVEEFKRSIPHIKLWLKLLVPLSEQKIQEQSFQSLIRVAHTIVSSIQNEKILDLILETAIQTIPVADTGFLFLYDEKIKKLTVQAAVGFRKESYMFTRLAPGEGISGRVFLTKKPACISGSENIQSAMENMSPMNRKYYLDSTIYSSYPVSVMSVPLNYQNQCIGVLTIDNFLQKASFSEEHLQLLQAFADLSAVVIQHSKLFHQVHRQNQELSMIHQALSKEHESLQRTVDFHNQLTNIAAKGYGMEEILATLYRSVGVKVAVYDKLLVPLSGYPKMADFSLPDQFLMHPSMKLVNKTRKWQRVDLDENETMIVIPVIGAERLLGYLCAWISQEEFIDIGKLIFEYSATMLALDWIKKEAVRESLEHLKGQFVEEILGREINNQLIEQAHILGFNQEDYYFVTLIENEEKQKENHHLWKPKFYNWLEQHGLNGLNVRKGKNEVVIISFPEHFPINRRTNLLRKFIDVSKQWGKLKIGIGRIQKGLNRIKKSFTDAQQCMELFKMYNLQQSVLYFGNLGVIRFFLQHDREELQSFMEEYLGPLIEYEHKKNKGLLSTLLAYVHHEKDIGKITKDLNIHYNTLYYRLNKIKKILGYSFDQSENWLNVRLACQIYLFLENRKE